MSSSGWSCVALVERQAADDAQAGAVGRDRAARSARRARSPRGPTARGRARGGRSGGATSGSSSPVETARPVAMSSVGRASSSISRSSGTSMSRRQRAHSPASAVVKLGVDEDAPVRAGEADAALDRARPGGGRRGRSIVDAVDRRSRGRRRPARRGGRRRSRRAAPSASAGRSWPRRSSPGGSRPRPPARRPSRRLGRRRRPSSARSPADSSARRSSSSVDALLDALERLDDVALEALEDADGVLVGAAADSVGVVVRLGDDPPALRLGLPGSGRARR